LFFWQKHTASLQPKTCLPHIAFSEDFPPLLYWPFYRERPNALSPKLIVLGFFFAVEGRIFPTWSGFITPTLDFPPLVAPFYR